MCTCTHEAPREQRAWQLTFKRKFCSHIVFTPSWQLRITAWRVAWTVARHFCWAAPYRQLDYTSFCWQLALAAERRCSLWYAMTKTTMAATLTSVGHCAWKWFSNRGKCRNSVKWSNIFRHNSAFCRRCWAPGCGATMRNARLVSSKIDDLRVAQCAQLGMPHQLVAVIVAVEFYGRDNATWRAAARLLLSMQLVCIWKCASHIIPDRAKFCVITTCVQVFPILLSVNIDKFTFIPLNKFKSSILSIYIQSHVSPHFK